MKHFYPIVLFLALSATVLAQTDYKYTPTLQTIDDGFFDPTREEKKRDPYEFKMEYRLEVGYTQIEQRVPKGSEHYGSLYAPRIGASFTFLLPYHFAMQTGVFYSIGIGTYKTRYRSGVTDSVRYEPEFIRHHLRTHYLTIPVRAYYTIPVWRKLNLFAYTGPQLQIGLAQNDKLENFLSDQTVESYQNLGMYVPTKPYERYGAGDFYRCNIQYGLGGGIEWDAFRLQGGYDFGLNNLIKRQYTSSQRMWEWQWSVMFSYRF